MSDIEREWPQLLLWSAVGAATIAAAAQISIPMVPVPTTLQTLAVVFVALASGPRVGAGATALYLLAVVLGLPVLSGAESHGGLAFLELKSAGYVVGFVPAAALIGSLGRREGAGWLVAAGLAGHALVLALGVSVLAAHIGVGPAIEHGLMPFLVGAVVKSVVPAGLVWGYRRSVGSDSSRTNSS